MIFYHPQFVHVFLSFEQLIGQQMVQLQDSILECLHHHTLSNILSNGISKAHCARILSCSGPRAGVYLTIWPIFPSFWLTSLVFSTMLRIQLGLRYPSIANILWCVCTHPINLMGIQFLHCAHGNEHTWTHGVIVWDVSFHVGWKQLHAFPSNMFNSSHQQVNIVLTKYLHLHLSQCCHYWPNTSGFTSLILHHPKICCFRCRKPKNRAIIINTLLIKFSP
jgi:hypothetical protein